MRRLIPWVVSLLNNLNVFEVLLEEVLLYWLNFSNVKFRSLRGLFRSWCSLLVRVFIITENHLTVRMMHWLESGCRSLLIIEPLRVGLLMRGLLHSVESLIFIPHGPDSISLFWFNDFWLVLILCTIYSRYSWTLTNLLLQVTSLTSIGAWAIWGETDLIFVFFVAVYRLLYFVQSDWDIYLLRTAFSQSMSSTYFLSPNGWAVLLSWMSHCFHP